MQVLCMPASAEKCDIECPVCRQKFAIYYARTDAHECSEARETVAAALLEHHGVSHLPSAHPVEAFNVPAWDGPAHASAAAMLSGAPVPPPSRYKSAPLTVLPNPQQRRVS
jgi:hypothetical protein